MPELRRFMGLTGRVKTVNMNGQVLVQFDHPVDIGWYDIHPTYLKVVDAPVKKEPTPHAEEKKANPAPATAPAKPVAPAAPAAAGGKKLSPLELARQQAAAKAAGGAAPAPAPAAPAGKKLSPLELARQQGSKKAAEAAATTEATAAPAPAAPEAPAAAPAAEAPAKPAAPAGKKLSPLEMARLQGALKKKPE